MVNRGRGRQAEARKAGGALLRRIIPALLYAEVERMEVDILTLIGNYAFPIVACIALFWKMDKDQDRHKEEMDAIRESLDSNTKAVLELTAFIKNRED